EHRALEERAGGDVVAAGHRGEARRVAAADAREPAVEDTARIPRQDQLALGQRCVELRPGRGGAVAELRVARPDPDTDRRLLVGILAGRAESGPAPGQ